MAHRAITLNNPILPDSLLLLLPLLLLLLPPSGSSISSTHSAGDAKGEPALPTAPGPSGTGAVWLPVCAALKTAEPAGGQRAFKNVPLVPGQTSGAEALAKGALRIQIVNGHGYGYGWVRVRVRVGVRKQDKRKRKNQRDGAKMPKCQNAKMKPAIDSANSLRHSIWTPAWLILRVSLRVPSASRGAGLHR